jgi:hypothetical protein
MSKCNCLLQKSLLTTGIRTRDSWFSLDLRPLDQLAVKATFKVTALTSETDCDQTAMGLPPVTEVFHIAQLFR